MDQQLKSSVSFAILGMAIKTISQNDAILSILEDIDSSSGNIAYDDLTAIIYEDEKFFDQKVYGNEFQEFINDSTLIVKNSDLTLDQKQNYEKYLNKISRHVSLAIIQRSFIENISRDAESKIVSLEETIDMATIKMKNSEKGLEGAKLNLVSAEEKLSETKGNMYTEFIAILGIFSALIFGLFGSFDAVSSALTKISENSSISEVIVFSCIIIVPLLILVYCLLYWVGKLANKKLKSCNCDDQSCECTIFKKHKTFFIMSSLIGVIGIIGLIGTLLDLLPIKNTVGVIGQLLVLIIVLLNLLRFVYNNTFNKEFTWRKLSKKIFRKKVKVE